MSDEPTMKPDASDGDATGQMRKRRPWRRPWRRLALWLGAALLALCVAAAGFVAYIASRDEPFPVPKWAQTRLETELTRALAPYGVRLGGSFVVIGEGWVPRVLLEDTEVLDAAGSKLVTLEDLSVELALDPLLTGRVQPVEVALSGARLSVRRDVEGTFWLSFDEALSAGGNDRGPQEIIAALDGLMKRDALGRFEQLSLHDVTLRYEDERARRNWTVDGGRFVLTRDRGAMRARADFALLTGGASAAGMEMTLSRPSGASEIFIGMNLADFPARDLATQSPALSWLEALNAPISGALRVSMNEVGQLGPLNATLQIGAGVLQPTEAATPVPFERASTYLSYDPEKEIITFDEVAVEADWATWKSEGTLGLELGANGWPESFVGQFRFADIVARPEEFLSREIRFERGFADLRLSAQPFAVELGQLGLQEGDTTLLMEGSLAALEEGWTYRLQAKGRDLGLEQVLGFWPETVDEKTRKWVGENVKQGRISEAQFALRAEPGERPEPHFSFGFEEVELQFLKGLPPIKGLAGQASILNKRFAAYATRGTITAPQGGKLKVAGTQFVIPRTKPKPAKARVTLRARGRVTALLSTIDLEPLRLMSKAQQPVTIADGSIDVRGTLGWTMQRPVPIDAINYDLTAVARDVRSETVVLGRVLASPKLDIVAKTGALTIAGSGRLGAIPVSGKFTAPVGQGSWAISTVAGQVELSPEFVREFNLGLPRGSVSGRGRGDLALELKRGQPPSFTLTSNLAGIGLAIPQIGWRKAEGNSGALTVRGQLGEAMSVDQLSLEAAGLKADGRVELDGKAFKEARFERVTIGSWLDVPLRIAARGQGRAPLIEIGGGRLDLSQTNLGEGGSGAPEGAADSSPISARLDTLKISSGISLSPFRGEFTTRRGFAGEFSGAVNGAAPVTGAIVPQGGRSAFRIRSKDGGRVLKAAGLLQNASGGDFNLTLAPARAPGTYVGDLKMGAVRLKDAPSMAALLNAISVVGLLEQLGGSGILFNEVEARFQLTPSRVVVNRSSAVGTSMGISMDGYYALGSGAMDMQGVVSPLYLVNGIGQIFTRKGEGLVGFNYSLSGTANEPRVKVNPLSIFTPGMFRDIFRRAPPREGQ